MSLKATRRNLGVVLTKLAEMARDPDPNVGKTICTAVNEMLDDLLSNDFFGTEGQLDPRGDHRDES